MNEPERWLDGGELTDEERRALSAGMNVGIPGHAEGAVWSAICAKLPLAAAGAALGATTAKAAGAALGAGAATAKATGAALGAGVATAVTTTALVKMALVGMALGAVTTGAVIGAHRVLERAPVPNSTASLRARATPAPALPAGSASVAPPAPALAPWPELPGPPPASSEPRAQGVTSHAPSSIPEPMLERETPSPSVAAFPVPTPSSAGSTSSGARDLGSAAAESRRVAEARTQLRSGDARGALALLDGARRDFPNGVLAQERAALEIEALMALGERATARQRATEFLRRYPGSPHRATAERALH